LIFACYFRRDFVRFVATSPSLFRETLDRLLDKLCFYLILRCANC